MMTFQRYVRTKEGLSYRKQGNRLIHSSRKKKIVAPVTRSRVHGSRRDLDQCVRPGLMCPSTCCFAEKRSYEEKSWQKYENLTNIRIHVFIVYTCFDSYRNKTIISQRAQLMIRTYVEVSCFHSCTITGDHS